MSYHFGVFAAVAALSIMAGGQNLSPLAIAELPGNQLVLQHYAQAGAPFASALPRSDMSELEPYSLILTNLSSKSILGLTVRWVTTDSSGRKRTFDYRTDSFFTARRPVLAGNSRLLVAPGFLAPEGTGYTGPGKDEALLARFRDGDTVSVYIDAVIFDDGQVVGPDRSQTVEQIKARKVAADYVAKTVLEVLKSGGDPARLLVQLAGTRPEHSDLVGVWKSRIAQRLLRSRNLAKVVEVLQNLPVPNLRQ